MSDGASVPDQALVNGAASVSALSGFDPSRVLFLDIDGVVLGGPNLWKHGNRYLPPEKIALVREVCDRTGALVVVSSTWRYSDDTADMLRFAGLTLHRDWRTPQPSRSGTLFIAEGRGLEIYRWLARHPEVTSYAIVDDDSDMLPEQRARFVQTKFEVGIEREHVEALVAAIAMQCEHEDAKRLSPEGVAARAEGIANTLSD